VLGCSASDDRPDPSRSELSTVAVVVVATVADKLVGTAARSADDAAYGRYAVDERDQLGDVVAVAACEREDKRDAALVDEQVVLGAQPPTGNRTRAVLAPPFCLHVAGINRRPRPLDLSGGAQPLKQ
jgi:hypothetical protein